MEKPFPPRAGPRLWRRYLKLIPLLKSSFKIPGRKDTLRMAMPFQRQKLKPPENLYAYVLLEGHTRPAMKQAKCITCGSGVYSCIVVFNKLAGKTLAARDRSCAAESFPNPSAPQKSGNNWECLH